VPTAHERLDALLQNLHAGNDAVAKETSHGMSLSPGLERRSERDGSARGSKSPRRSCTASVETYNEVRRLRDELTSERRSKDLTIDIERGKVNACQKQVESLKQHVSSTDAKLVEIDQHYQESQRVLR
jgi:hypothetical protein